MAAPSIDVARTVADLRVRVAGWRGDGLRIGLVPTMGALHEGHLALIDAARGETDRVVATIFVNPSQFGPGEDFEAYPRDEQSDLDALAMAGTELVFIPDGAEMYPAGFQTSVTVVEVSQGLCGDHRPGHFQGVATVVSKLLIQAQADRAYFGEKDYQQLRVITRMARDLDIPTAIVGVPTVREADGLALSSRNRYLDGRQRAAAPALYRTLREIAADVGAGRVAGSAAAAIGSESLLAAGFDKVDYVAVCDAETLQPVERPSRPGRALAAAWLGRARLIDNVPVDPGAA